MLWRIGDFPELDHLDPPQRAGVLARVPWWTYPIIVIRAVVPAAIGGGIIAGLIGNWGSDASDVLFVLLFLPVAMSLYLLQLKRLRIVTRKSISDALQGERPPFCFACGYNLRGSDTLRCPECGENLTDVASRGT